MVIDRDQEAVLERSYPSTPAQVHALEAEASASPATLYRYLAGAFAVGELSVATERLRATHLSAECQGLLDELAPAEDTDSSGRDPAPGADEGLALGAALSVLRLAERGSLDSATSSAQRLIDAASDSPWGYQALGILRALRGDRKGSLESFTRAEDQGGVLSLVAQQQRLVAALSSEDHAAARSAYAAVRRLRGYPAPSAFWAGALANRRALGVVAVLVGFLAGLTQQVMLLALPGVLVAAFAVPSFQATAARRTTFLRFGRVGLGVAVTFALGWWFTSTS